MVISLENVTKIFGRTRVLDDVSVKFPAGKISVVTGDHRAGKTIMLRLLAGELKPDSGRVTPKHGCSKGFSFEIGKSIPKLKTADLCTVWMLLYRNFDIKIFRSMLAEGGIAENSRFLHLSNAQKSWFSGSLLIASNADIMIFDEPLKYFDSEMKLRFLEILDNAAKQDKAVIVSSNEIVDFEKSAGFVAALSSGNLVLSGETETLLASHRLMPGASTISPDFKVIGPVLNERLVETTDEVGRSATLKEIVLGYVNGSSS